jgi:hypothetical protein
LPLADPDDIVGSKTAIDFIAVQLPTDPDRAPLATALLEIRSPCIVEARGLSTSVPLS